MPISNTILRNSVANENLYWIIVFTLALTLSACQSNKNHGLIGVWESEVNKQPRGNEILSIKKEIRFSDNTYQYSWYKKLAMKEGSIIYDWSEVARETGWDSITEGYMQWTANLYGAAKYNKEAGGWSSIKMSPSTNNHSIFFSLNGNKLILKEDLNLDGDFDDVIDGEAEITLYLKK
ncbi:hypothetical conserved protein [Candidatus Nitrosoglobus terrae]|uniref:Hypothetical conserved protein n=1 Tax=Candidatus Nitrosoglobus terrae TaxID=1630141 RepID=A0A1Q2SP17_9GAMM|nr:hypothetical protein [Candidatus Nitrosoglobus terrae]BAW80888.1 hypothetical conserved protein [Candidatus Nitrosoglobus terrae]